MLGALLISGGAVLLAPLGIATAVGAVAITLGADVIARSSGGPGLAARLTRRRKGPGRVLGFRRSKRRRAA